MARRQRNGRPAAATAALLAAALAVAGPGAVAQAAGSGVPTVQDERRPGLHLLLERVEDRHEGATDLEARFVQRSLNRFNVVARQKAGHLQVRTPGLMRWQYDDGMLLVATREEMYLWLPERNQVQVILPQESRSPTLPILYLSGEGDLTRDFEVESGEWGEPLARGNIQLRLTPRRTGAFRYLILEVEPMSATIARIVNFENSGNVVDYQFHEVRFDVGVGDEAFEFEIPDGADVMYMEGG